MPGTDGLAAYKERYIATPSGQIAYCYECDTPLTERSGYYTVIRNSQLVAVHPRCARRWERERYG